jgi:probable HAF family extracellular repeat protein
MPRHPSLGLCCLLAAALSLLGRPAAAGFYSVTDLGTLGGRTSQAIGVSADGRLVVRTAQTASGESHAFLYQNSVMTDLGTLGGTGSVAYAVNDAGQVVGYSQTATGATHAFRYSGGIMMDLGTLGGTNSEAFAINQSGQATGVADVPGNSGYGHAFLYAPGTRFPGRR